MHSFPSTTGGVCMSVFWHCVMFVFVIASNFLSKLARSPGCHVSITANRSQSSLKPTVESFDPEVNANLIYSHCRQKPNSGCLSGGFTRGKGVMDCALVWQASQVTIIHLQFFKILTVTLILSECSSKQSVDDGLTIYIKGNSLFWISPCSSLQFVWGDEEMEIISWLGKASGPQLANESGLPVAHLVTRPLCGRTRPRGHCCFPALSLWKHAQTHFHFHMHEALIQFCAM